MQSKYNASNFYQFNETFFKYEIAVYRDPVKRPVKEAVADILNNSFTLDVPPQISVGSGEDYEVIGEHELGVELAPRPTCPRGMVKLASYRIILSKVYKYT